MDSSADDMRQDHFHGPAGGDLPDLSEVLLAGERVCFVGRGRVLTSRVPRFGRWFIIVTSRRLVLLKDERRPIRQQWHVALNRVESAYQAGMIRSKVEIRTQDGKFRIRGLSRFSGAQLVSWLVGPRGRSYDAGAFDSTAVTVRPAHPAQPAMDTVSAQALIAAERVLTRIEDLESDVDRLGKQVRFLEDLLESRQLAAPLQLKAPEE
jgi:hypothetical protein